MRLLLIGLVAAIGFAPQVSGQAQAPAAPKVQLTFEAGGNVSLSAQGATLREILDEWAKKGGTAFEGEERMSGGPMTVQYQHRPETEVLRSLLRNASGVIIAARLEEAVGASQTEVVFVLATSSATAGGYSAPPTYNAAPQVSSVGFPNDEIAPVGPGRAGQPPPMNTAPTPNIAPRPAGVSGVAVPVVAAPSTSAPPPTTTPPPTTGRGGGGGGGR